jgi:uncharacterized membrane protein YvbJ
MVANLASCQHCGKQVMKGAMRCPSCGKILKTAEEQLASVERYRESQKTSPIGAIVKIIILVVIIGIGYKYQAEIIEFVQGVMGK